MQSLNRRFRTGLLAIAGLLALGSAGFVAAAPMDVTRAADGELGFCREGYVCTARAVGDFNGDKIDDLVFEVATREAMVEQLRFSAFNVPTERVFEVHLGPFQLRSASVPGLPDDLGAAQIVHLSLATAQAIDVLRAHDIDGDGRDDLVFAQLPEAALLVLRGQRSWKPYYRLDRGSQDVVAIAMDNLDERLFNADGRFLQPVGLSSAVADVNGDGRPDLVIGRDLGEPGSRLRQSDAFILPGTGLWSDFERFAWSTHIVGIGGCTQGLAGTGDVTGDGLADIVLRRCVADSQPTELRVLPGRQDWPGMISAENVPDIIPPPVTVPPPGGGGGGGGYLPSRPENPLSMPPQVLIEDINGDGVTDIGIEFAGKTHLYHGGADIVARARANHTSGALQKLGLGAMPLTHSWKLMDLNGDDARDLLLSQSIDDALLACPSGGCGESVRALSSQPIYGFTGVQRHSAVLDPRLDAPDLLWQSSGNVAWGSGDFNGDGLDDLLLGSAPGAFDSIYAFVNGPILSRFGGEDGRTIQPGLPASGVER